MFENDGYYRQKQLRREKEWLSYRRQQQKDETEERETDFCQQETEILGEHEKTIW